MRLEDMERKARQWKVDRLREAADALEDDNAVVIDFVENMQGRPDEPVVVTLDVEIQYVLV